MMYSSSGESNSDKGKDGCAIKFWDQTFEQGSQNITPQFTERGDINEFQDQMATTQPEEKDNNQVEASSPVKLQNTILIRKGSSQQKSEASSIDFYTENRTSITDITSDQGFEILEQIQQEQELNLRIKEYNFTPNNVEQNEENQNIIELKCMIKEAVNKYDEDGYEKSLELLCDLEDKIKRIINYKKQKLNQKELNRVQELQNFVILKMGKIEQELENYDEAMGIFSELLQESKSIYGNDSFMLIQPLLAIGKLYLELGNLENCKKMYETSMNLININKKKKDQQLWSEEQLLQIEELHIMVLIDLGKLELKQNNVQKSEECINLAVKKLDQINEAKIKNSSQLLVQQNYSIAQYFNHSGKQELALGYYYKAVNCIHICRDKNFLYAMKIKILKKISQNNKEYDNKEKVIDFYKSELQTLVEEYGYHNYYVSQLLNQLGELHHDQQEWDHAKDYYKQALSIYVFIFDRKNIKIADASINLGNIYYQQNQFEQAIKYYKAAQEIELILYGKNDIQTTDTLFNIGHCYLQLNKYSKAKQCLQQTITAHKAFYGNYEKCLENIKLLGDCYVALNYISQAQSMYDKVLKIYEKFVTLSEKDQLLIGNLFMNYGSIYKQQSKMDQAQEYYEKALKILKDVYGENSCQVLDLYKNLGEIFYSYQELNQALQYFNKYVQIYKQQQQNIVTSRQQLVQNFIKVLHKIGKIYYQNGQLTESQNIYSECQAQYNNNKFAYSKEDQKLVTKGLIETNKRLGMINFDLKNYVQSLKFFEMAQEQENKLYGEVQIETMINIGQVYLKKDKAQKAKNYIETAHKLLKKQYGDRHIKIGFTMTLLGKVMQQLGKKQQSKEYYEKSLVIYRENLQDSKFNQIEYATLLHYYGQILGEFESYSLSKQYYLESQKIYQSYQGSHSENVREILLDISKVLQDMGAIDESEKYQRKAENITSEYKIYQNL